MWKYKFKHWLFQWIEDESGDIGLKVARIICFIKYKEHTIIHSLFSKEWKTLKKARKYRKDTE